VRRDVKDFRIGESEVVCFMPAYNAAHLMEDVIRSIPQEAWDALSVLLVVDDGSTDGTSSLARDLSGEFPLIRILAHETNRGYGAVQKSAFDWMLAEGGDVALMLHSDGQYPPASMLDMLKPFEDGAEVVGGSRTLYGDMREGGMSRPRYYGTLWLNSLENLVFGASLTSYHSGYKAYSREALEQIPYHRYSDTFNFDSEMLVGAIRADLRISEVPVPTIHGEGYSSLKPVPYGISVLRTIVRYIFGRI
jgi:glycosyltransferase involved in cell wall biosynthesis